MKVRIDNKEKQFQPFNIVITIENNNDLDFWHAISTLDIKIPKLLAERVKEHNPVDEEYSKKILRRLNDIISDIIYQPIT